MPLSYTLAGSREIDHVGPLRVAADPAGPMDRLYWTDPRWSPTLKAQHEALLRAVAPDPPQRPPPAHLHDRLGEERRPLDRPYDPSRRRNRGGSHPIGAACPAARLRPRLRGTRLRLHHALRPAPRTPATGLLAGDETRQQAYTMLTRGRHTNHAYLVIDRKLATEHDHHEGSRKQLTTHSAC